MLQKFRLDPNSTTVPRPRFRARRSLCCRRGATGTSPRCGRVATERRRGASAEGTAQAPSPHTPRTLCCACPLERPAKGPTAPTAPAWRQSVAAAHRQRACASPLPHPPPAPGAAPAPPRLCARLSGGGAAGAAPRHKPKPPRQCLSPVHVMCFFLSWLSPSFSNISVYPRILFPFLSVMVDLLGLSLRCV
jgi:hypothetical protein